MQCPPEDGTKTGDRSQKRVGKMDLFFGSALLDHFLFPP